MFLDFGTSFTLGKNIGDYSTGFSVEVGFIKRMNRLLSIGPSNSYVNFNYDPEITTSKDRDAYVGTGDPNDWQTKYYPNDTGTYDFGYLLTLKGGNILLAYDDLENGNNANPANADIKKEMEILSKQTVIASRSTKKEISNNTQPERKPEVVAKKEQPPIKQEAKSTQTVNREYTETAILQKEVVVQPKVEEPAAPSLADAFKDEKRFALVIGNSNYPKAIGALKNPVNDATDIAKELTNSNFEVELLTNATYGQMRAAMLKFKEKVDAGDRDKTVSLFYYAGHGLQHDQENFLVPIDASIEYEDDIARYCFAVQRMVLSNMERSNSTMNIVILDACRNNPFPALTRSAGQQGLGEMKRARGSFIAYATAPGSVASDGSGRNGLYTQELLKSMRKSGLTIEQVFKEVRQSVLRMSGDKQNTWDSSNIVGEFYFKF